MGDLESLKELINMRFEELEKRIREWNENTAKDIDILFDRKREADKRIQELEQGAAVAKAPGNSTWKTIQESFLRWLVPFAMAAILLAIKGGVTL
jgi:hypothetical protein